ncbi:MAG: HypC/HybG/HupF family hydrogenase formation chaperone [Acidimicrobiales bacterium]|nr:HypC/HybG/HupF family hydrogenase formation chaperone [Acidimicrobiales bacterium]
MTVIDDDLIDELASTAFAMAKCIAAGARLWCIAPDHPEHARHLAVEFVHPVIVGKQALPAVSLAGPGLVRSARSMARPGDVLIAVGAPHGELAELLRRSPAWGVRSVWLGTEPYADGPLADHEVIVDDRSGIAAYDGTMVTLYHLLWELTHVCLEAGVGPGARGDAATCVVCSDEALLGEVMSIDGDSMATVCVAGRVSQVDVSLVDAPSTDDLVLVHAGTAISRVERPGSG